ncbi:MAG: hypothetical protein OXR72_10900 [Gemmatimonadota bacterium]|nr:hypothetical protein [Gemmatimonadota bacterium]
MNAKPDAKPTFLARDNHDTWAEIMEDANGDRGDLYEEVLEHARREINASASQVEELRRALNLLEARVEAAKAVYEAAAARLNLQDESDGQGLSVSESLASVQALLSDDEPRALRSRPRNHSTAGLTTRQQGGEKDDPPESWRRFQIGGSTLVWKRVKKPKRRRSQRRSQAS